MSEEERRWLNRLWAEVQRLGNGGSTPKSKNQPFVAAVEYFKRGYTAEQAARFYLGIENAPVLRI